jgi:uncharacterized protein with ParB-like and HNH nuclease domain
MESGLLVVPAFQRGFVWESKHIIQLLESVYKGFPIGNIILAEANIDSGDMLYNKESLFPEIKEEKLLSYSNNYLVIDGVQRLSTLYNCFHDSKNEKFNVYFNLRNKKFVYPNSNENLKMEDCIKLSSLYNSKKFIKFQMEVSSRDNAETLIDEANNLHLIFEEYQVIVQIISNASNSDAIFIFESINRTGMHLTKEEIENARRKRD